MTKFIELTKENGDNVLINVSHIVFIEPPSDSDKKSYDTTKIYFTKTGADKYGSITIKASYEDVKNRLAL